MPIKKFFSRLTAPEMPMFTQKIVPVYKVKIIDCKTCDSRTYTMAQGGVQSLAIRAEMF